MIDIAQAWQFQRWFSGTLPPPGGPGDPDDEVRANQSAALEDLSSRLARVFFDGDETWPQWRGEDILNGIQQKFSSAHQDVASDFSSKIVTGGLNEFMVWLAEFLPTFESWPVIDDDGANWLSDSEGLYESDPEDSELPGPPLIFISEPSWDEGRGAWWRTVSGPEGMHYEFHVGYQYTAPPSSGSPSWKREDAFQETERIRADIAMRAPKVKDVPSLDGGKYSTGAYPLRSMDPAYRGEEGPGRAVYQVKYPPIGTAKYRRITQDFAVSGKGKNVSIRARMIAPGGEEVEDGTYGWAIGVDEDFFLFDAYTGSCFLYDDKGRVVDKKQIPYFDPSASEESQKLTIAEFHNLRAQGFQIQRHSSTVGGEPVIGAGMCFIINGRIKELTDSSGHYKPFAQHVDSSAQILYRRGFMEANCMIKLAGVVDDESGRPVGKKWISELADLNWNVETAEISIDRRVLALAHGDEFLLRIRRAAHREMKQRRERVLEEATTAAVQEYQGPEDGD